MSYELIALVLGACLVCQIFVSVIAIIKGRKHKSKLNDFLTSEQRRQAQLDKLLKMAPEIQRLVRNKPATFFPNN